MTGGAITTGLVLFELRVTGKADIAGRGRRRRRFAVVTPGAAAAGEMHGACVCRASCGVATGAVACGLMMVGVTRRAGLFHGPRQVLPVAVGARHLRMRVVREGKRPWGWRGAHGELQRRRHRIGLRQLRRLMTARAIAPNAVVGMVARHAASRRPVESSVLDLRGMARRAAYGTVFSVLEARDRVTRLTLLRGNRC